MLDFEWLLDISLTTKWNPFIPETCKTIFKFLFCYFDFEMLLWCVIGNSSTCKKYVVKKLGNEIKHLLLKGVYNMQVICSEFKCPVSSLYTFSKFRRSYICKKFPVFFFPSQLSVSTCFLKAQNLSVSLVLVWKSSSNGVLVLISWR